MQKYKMFHIPCAGFGNKTIYRNNIRSFTFTLLLALNLHENGGFCVVAPSIIIDLTLPQKAHRFCLRLILRPTSVGIKFSTGQESGSSTLKHVIIGAD